MSPRTDRLKRLAFVHIIIPLFAVFFGCAPAPEPVAPAPQDTGTASAAAAPPSPSATPSAAASASPDAKPYPKTPAEAEELKKKGVSWTNEETRVYYLKLVESVESLNERWKQEGLSAEERAKRAYEVRRNARITARAMMSDPKEVEDLRKRDQEKYGNPDGPTFEYLVESQKKKGVTGDAIYEAIIGSSQRSDQKTNEQFNLKGAQ